MKLIDEGIARLSEQAAAENWPNGKLYNAIYCMGLERAAKVCEDMQWGADAGDCAAAIREMAQ
jgi:hypothetical protein